MKVKVRRVKGTTGNQRGFGLVTGSIWNYEDKPTSNNVGTTMGAVPRDEANIEAERGETVVFPNYDGSVAHAKIGGERHYAGGTPLNVPDGSFIFSDTPALRIKNKDVLKNIFKMGGSKPATPADVAKRYEINKYVEILNDPLAEPIDKKTAQLMIDNNMKKLGQLALLQESMKGFPDGIPDIALPLFGSDIAQSQPMQQPSQEQPVARYGGMPKYQPGGRYESEMKKFNDWEKRWKNALVKNDVAQLQQLKAEGKKLSEVLNSVDIPFNLPINFSFLDPNSRRVSWGTDEGKLADAGDVIDNYLSFWEGAGKRASQAATNTKQNFQTKKEANLFYNDALKVINDYQEKSGLSTYSPVEINNAYKIVEELSPKENIVLSEYKYDKTPNRTYYNPLQQINKKDLNEIVTKYPIKSAVKTAISQKPVDKDAIGTQLFNVASDTDTIIPFKNTTSSTTTSADPKKTTASKLRTVDATPSSPTVTDEQIKTIMSTSLGLPMDSIKQVQVDAYRGRMREGGELQKAQIAGQFIVNDPKLQAAAAERKLKIARPYSHYDPELPIIGSQLPSSKNYEISPEGIIYRSGTAIPKIDEYKNYPVDWSQYGKDGFEQWKKDIAAGKGTTSAASKWFTEQADKYAVSKTGVPYFGSGPKEAIPGYKWSTAPIFEDLPAEVTAATPAATTPGAKTAMEDIGETKYESGVEQTPWWNYDVVNYTNQLGNYASIDPGNLPPYQQYNPYLADPTFVDPARAIAQQQGLVRGSQEAIMSAANPTTGRANVIAAQAAAAPQVANIMAQYDQANVGIANQFGQQNAQTMNQAQMQNLQLKKRYADELEVRRQQYENALREGKTNVAESIMQAMENSNKTGLLNVQSDSYSVDPRSGNIYFKRGFDPKTGAFRSQTGSVADAFKQLRAQGFTDQEAKLILELQIRSKQPMQRESNLQAQYGGMFNPMDLIWNS